MPSSHADSGNPCSGAPLRSNGASSLATAIAAPLRLVCLTTNDSNAAPKTLPSIVAGRAALTVLGPDQVKLTYDTVRAYAWDAILYVDQSIAWTYRRGIDPPTVETQSRLKTGVEISLK